MKKILILLLLLIGARMVAQENPGTNGVSIDMEDRSIAPALTELRPNVFLHYDPNLPSGTFIGVDINREEFDMVGIIHEVNEKREMAKAKRLANINLPQSQPKEKAIQLSGNNNQERNQLNNNINSFNNNLNTGNPFYQYHNALYNNAGTRGGFYSQPSSYNSRYRYY